MNIVSFAIATQPKIIFNLTQGKSRQIKLSKQGCNFSLVRV